MTIRYYRKSGHPLELACCEACGESRTPALRKKLINGYVYCMNCTARNKPLKICEICERLKPTEEHHIGGRGNAETANVCLNCHSRLSELQGKYKEFKHFVVVGKLFMIYVFIEVYILGFSDIKS